MNLFRNKFLAGVFILFITIYLLSASAAQAGGVVDLFSGIVSTLITVVQTSLEITVCVSTIGIICPNNDSVGVTLMPTVTAGETCYAQIPMTFYNPQNVTPSSDETGRQVAIYRFTLPANSDQATLNTWFVNTIKANVGGGWMAIPFTMYGEYFPLEFYEHYISAVSEPSPLITLPYADLCVGNVCKFTDGTMSENFYVAYAAKILGDYSSYEILNYTSENGPTGAVVTHPNKFLNNNNDASAAFFPASADVFSLYHNTIGNAINGPYKTNPCPPPPYCFNEAINYPACDIFNPCPNGANNPPTCTTYNPCSNGANNPPTCTTYNPCSNGANNPPTCDIFNPCSNGANNPPTCTTYNPCSNGATNPPTCDTCQSGYILSGGTCVPTPPTASISADSTSIAYNTGTTVRWSSTNATSCTVSPPGWTGASGAQSTGNLTSSTVYTVNCSGAGGSVSNSVTINVGGAPSLTFTADSTSVVYNARTTLRWSSSNTTYCTASGAWSGSKPLSGSEATDNLTSSKTYTLTCGGPGSSVSANVTVTIQPPGSFSVSLGGSVACNSVPLSWTAALGAQAYRILRGSPRVDISPYQPYTALNFTDATVSQNTTYLYQIEAYNSGGSNRSNIINVSTPYCPPTISSFSSSQSSIYQGQSVTLSWTTTFTTSCSASGDWSGSQPVNGSMILSPVLPSVTYNLTCTGPGSGSAFQSVTVSVLPLSLPEWREIIPR